MRLCATLDHFGYNSPPSSSHDDHRWTEPALVLEHIETLRSLLLPIEKPFAAMRGGMLSPKPLVIPGTDDAMFSPIPVSKKKKSSHKRKHKADGNKDGENVKRRKEHTKKPSTPKVETISLAPPVKVIVPVYGGKPKPSASATLSVAPSSEVTGSVHGEGCASATPAGSVTHVIPRASVKAPSPLPSKASRPEQPVRPKQRMPTTWEPDFVITSSDDDDAPEAKEFQPKK